MPLAVERPRPARTRTVNPVRYVYFVQAQALRLIKIGITNDVPARMRSMFTSSPDRLDLLGVIASEEADLIEGKLHSKFRAHRVHGEWFNPAPDILDLIARFASPLETAVAQKLCFMLPEAMSAEKMAEADAALERFLASVAARPV